MNHIITCQFVGLFKACIIITYKNLLYMTTMVQWCFCFCTQSVKTIERQVYCLQTHKSEENIISSALVHWFSRGTVTSAQKLFCNPFFIQKALLWQGSDVEGKAVFLGYIFTPREGLQICFWLYLTKQILQQTTHHDGVMMEEATVKNINPRSS